MSFDIVLNVTYVSEILSSKVLRLSLIILWNRFLRFILLEFIRGIFSVTIVLDIGIVICYRYLKKNYVICNSNLINSQITVQWNFNELNFLFTVTGYFQI